MPLLPPANFDLVIHVDVAGVEVLPESPRPNTWRSREGGHGSFGRHEHPLAQEDQLADRHAIACDNEGLPLFKARIALPLSLRSSRWVIRSLMN
jgi:hypothetical protein